MLTRAQKQEIIPLEEEEQIALVQWLEALILAGKDITFSAIPNSTFTKSWAQKHKNTKTGLRAGLPDLFLIINNKPLFIEMKRIKNSTTSQEQKNWIDSINRTGLIKAYVCKGFEEARRVVMSYLDI